MFAQQLRISLDPVAVFKTALGVDPDDWQAALLRSDERQIICCTSRQIGKSTVCAAKAAHAASIDPAAALWSLARRCGRPVGVWHRGRRDRQSRPPCSDGPRDPARIGVHQRLQVWGLPGAERSIRGLSAVDLVVVDEAARIDDALISGLRPMLALRDGQIILASTPWARVGSFYDTWTAGGDDWQRFTVPATACPRLSPRFLERERRALGERSFAREYLCRFGSMRGNVFDEDDLLRSVDRSLQPLLPEDTILEDHAWHSETSGEPHVKPLLSEPRELAV